jgi:hypothetical protein
MKGHVIAVVVAGALAALLYLLLAGDGSDGDGGGEPLARPEQMQPEAPAASHAEPSASERNQGTPVATPAEGSVPRSESESQTPPEPAPPPPANPDEVPTGDGRPPGQRSEPVAEAPPTPEEPPRPPGYRPSTLPADTDALRRDIRGGFAELRPQLRTCYELLLALDPEAEDRIVFHLEVTADPDDAEHGLIELQAIDSAQLQMDDVSCFAELIDELEVPPPADPDGFYAISYPVVLDAD